MGGITITDFGVAGAAGVFAIALEGGRAFDVLAGGRRNGFRFAVVGCVGEDPHEASDSGAIAKASARMRIPA